ncbi:unnamed protein product [Hermetia illucens]|uniref:CS domain-containing protein n=1 Tax=Hermetia illucens TaxID=343691 RepID=A0A7R8V5F7_HERIL|nr:uncharacterized protein CG16817 [Hermetia illucens]CAD7093196.1 unnamed protein product [Hermetia illucens]
MSPDAAVPPPVSWAQQSDLLYVTVNVECKDVDYKFTENSMHFKGVSVLENKPYEVTLNFLRNINPDKVTLLNSKRSLEFKIYKAETGPFWPTLTNDKKKPHFLKVDFNKWKDDDSDQEQEPESMDLLNKLVDMGVGKDEKPSFDDFDDEEEDSDDENIPNLTDGSGDSNKDNPAPAETDTTTEQKN